MKLTPQDHQQLTMLGIEPDTLDEQMRLLQQGTKPVKLTAPATIGNGIIKLTDEQEEMAISAFSKAENTLTVTRFVPASGAASRMFKAFYQYLDDGQETAEIKYFADNFQKFAFYQQIKCENAPDYSCAINNMINVLKLAQLPKALIPFHLYADGPRTAFAEHLVEAAMIIGKGKTVNIHFTIAAAHQEKFDVLAAKVIPKYEQQFNCRFNLSFSYQAHATDTIAIDDNQQLVRTEKGELLFRPGGHGSLLHNLNSLNADIVFVKNIDNVQPDHLKADTVHYKKVLGGFLFNIHQKVHKLLSELKSKKNDLDAIAQVCANELRIKLPGNFNSLGKEKQQQWLFHKLNRPIRVCGMVKNQGEPGGGPFWVENNHAESLQIVESSQIDFANKQQADIFSKSTHFNPVDIACWIKDYRGQKFDLLKFIDPQTAFVTEKTYNGKPIKVLEHPGLWNGSMANWLTIFIEVPITTFTPVKTINDLLKPVHITTNSL